MKKNLQSFASILAACAVLTLILTAFNGWTLGRFIDLGSYVGGFGLVVGCWRLTNGASPTIDEVHIMQKLENIEAERAGRPAPHTSIVPMFISSGPLVLAGLSWLVLLQAVRYGLGVTLP